MTEASRPAPKLFTLIAIVAVSVVTMNLFTPVLPKMAEAFGAPYSVMSLAVSGYLALTAVVLLIAGPLSDRFGRRPVGLVSLGVFTLAAFAAAQAESVEAFLAFRFLQASVAAGWVVCLSVIRDTAPPGGAAARIALVAGAMAVAPMFAPMVGGALEAAFGWRATLHALWVAGALVFALVWFDLAETRPDEPVRRIRALAADYLTLLASPLFWAFAVCLSFSAAFFHVFVTGAPYVSATALGMEPEEIGVWMGATPVGFVIGSFLTSRIASRYEGTTLMIAGRVVAFAALGAAVLAIMSGHVSAPLIFGAAVMGGFGNGLTIPGANAGAMEAVPQAAGSAAGLAGALSVIVGGLAAQAAGAALTPDAGPLVLMIVACGCAAAGLIAALTARRIQRTRG